MARRELMHLRVARFFAAIEQRMHPSWRGRPVIVYGVHGRRIIDISAEASAQGVDAQRSLWEARCQCPDGHFVEADEGKYRAAWERVEEICGDYTPQVESRFGRGAILDLTGTGALFGPGVEVARDLLARLREEFGLRARCGLGPTRVVAELASRQAPAGGVTAVMPEEVEWFLSPLPLNWLTAIDGENLRKLYRWGLRRISDLSALPVEQLRRVLGDRAQVWHDLARGIDPRPVGVGATTNPGPRIERVFHFPSPTDQADRLRAAGRAALDDAGRALRGQRAQARLVRIGLGLRNGSERGAQRTVAEPTASTTALWAVAAALLDRLSPNVGKVYWVRVTLGRLMNAEAGRQLPLAPWRDLRDERLNVALDEIANRYGGRAIGAASGLALAR